MLQLDELLSVIENPARRKILESLVREPHYPLQLSKELGMSQQAVMKHLKVLENLHLVESYPEASDLGGPQRKKYVPASNFSIIMDVGPNMFKAVLVSRICRTSEKGEGREEDSQRFDARARGLRGQIGAIDAQLEELQTKREALIKEKEQAMDEVACLMRSKGDYQLRRVIYEFISRPELGPADIARELAIRDDIVTKMLRDLMEG
jgi:ArsR family transcriptional regulator